ncbi:MAG TPA: hypothetical protein VEK11_04770, partial [Thermoanaerobaculia bacterium]|nr:hypothetical protein [Thermoanaerobaculia bacterium]
RKRRWPRRASSQFNILHSAFCIRFMTDETPPILRSWRNLYTAVLLALAAEVALFYWFTRSFE